LLWPLLLVAATPEPPQAATGTAGTIELTVTDPSGASIVNATVKLENRASRFSREGTADQNGVVRFANVPPNPYHIEVSAPGFQTQPQDISVRTSVPLALKVVLPLAESKESVDVHADATDLVESVPTAHVDLDHELFSKLNRQTPAAGLSDAITLAAPGVVADSNGFFHPLGDHAETGFSVDNQPISDQQSKNFTNQMPLNAIGSMEVMAGAAPAEYGDKASMVVNAITRSGLGQAKPFGSASISYGSFGTIGENLGIGWGGPKWGNYIVANATRSGRYLDAPEFGVLHDIGNNQQFFDRVDWAPQEKDTLHMNLFLARSWFQIPNTYDQQDAGQDQRQQVRTYNISPGWVHLFSPTVALTVSPFYRQDEVRYYPSRDPFADLPATVSQSRDLRNFGVKADVAYVKGIHNFKIGTQVMRYHLNETFNLGITDPAFNPICLDANGDPVAGMVNPGGCAASGYHVNPNLQPGLIPYDLSRGGSPFNFHGITDIDQAAFFIQDSLTFGHLTVMAGLRADIYRGLSSDEGIQPRLGVSYLYKPTATVFRVSWARFFETPYNENLVLSSSTGAGGLASNIFGAFGAQPLRPGTRNQYNAGVQQAIGRFFSIDADYFWKYTRNAFDFDTLFNSPIQFPIEWQKSKIDGFSLRLNLAPVHGFSAYTVMGHTRARFFGPENGGIIFNSPVDASVFRIDHDQAFEESTNIRYQRGKDGLWISLTWRYDSGMVSGAVNDRASALGLTPNEQTTIGLYCGAQFATPTMPLTSCQSNQAFGSKLINIPAEGTWNADRNPARVAPRHLLDLAIGTDNLLRAKEGPRWTLQLSATNLANEAALYNFLSTFSGTHFVTPRAYRVELGYVF
jgi:outer membrane receptor protein involved in Fe transport